MRQNADHIIAVNEPNDRDKPGHRGLRSAPQWYFVCARCEAKWFSRTKESTCPRCQLESTSSERLLPPWRQLLPAVLSGPIAIESKGSPNNG